MIGGESKSQQKAHAGPLSLVRQLLSHAGMHHGP